MAVANNNNTSQQRALVAANDNNENQQTIREVQQSFAASLGYFNETIWDL